MKVWEMNREKGKIYDAFVNIEGDLVRYELKVDSVGNLRLDNGFKIEDILALNRILELEFEEVVNWSIVPVDTKVWVSQNAKDWTRRHFKELRDGTYVCFPAGKTSWSNKDSYDICEAWTYCVLVTNQL